MSAYGQIRRPRSAFSIGPSSTRTAASSWTRFTSRPTRRQQTKSATPVQPTAGLWKFRGVSPPIAGFAHSTDASRITSLRLPLRSGGNRYSIGRQLNYNWTTSSADSPSAMPLYPRDAASKIAEAFSDTRVVLIAGPRQSGKTTLAESFARENGLAFFSLDDPTVLAAARSDPVRLLRGQERAVIDEVQRAPDLLLAIKERVDRDRRLGRYLLTDSASLMRLPTVADSLAGRKDRSPSPTCGAGAAGTGKSFPRPGVSFGLPVVDRRGHSSAHGRLS